MNLFILAKTLANYNFLVYDCIINKKIVKTIKIRFRQAKMSKRKKENKDEQKNNKRY